MFPPLFPFGEQGPVRSSQQPTQDELVALRKVPAVRDNPVAAPSEAILDFARGRFSVRA